MGPRPKRPPAPPPEEKAPQAEEKRAAPEQKKAPPPRQMAQGKVLGTLMLNPGASIPVMFAGNALPKQVGAYNLPVTAESGTNIDQKLLTYITAGTLPDIIQTNDNFAKPYKENGVTQNMIPLFPFASILYSRISSK